MSNKVRLVSGPHQAKIHVDEDNEKKLRGEEDNGKKIRGEEDNDKKLQGEEDNAKKIQGEEDNAKKIQGEEQNDKKIQGDENNDEEEGEVEEDEEVEEEMEEVKPDPPSMNVPHTGMNVPHTGKIKVAFLKKSRLGTEYVRAYEASRLVNSWVGGQVEATLMECKQFQRDVCKGRRRFDVVVHVKWDCSCSPGYLAPNLTHIYDPIDALTTYGGLEDAILGKVGSKSRYVNPSLIAPECARLSCFSGYFVASEEMKRRADRALEAFPRPGWPTRTFVLPHHHSNFHNRQRPSDREPRIVAIAGGDKKKDISKSLWRALEQNGFGHVNVTRVDKLKCNKKQALQPSTRGDCFAMGIMQADIGVSWWQNFPGVKKTVLVEKPAQRLVNLLAVGLPSVAFGGYWANKDVLVSSNFSRLATTEKELASFILALLRGDAESRAAAFRESVELGGRYSPEAVAKIYLGVFRDLTR